MCLQVPTIFSFSEQLWGFLRIESASTKNVFHPSVVKLYDRSASAKAIFALRFRIILTRTIGKKKLGNIFQPNVFSGNGYHSQT